MNASDHSQLLAQPTRGRLFDALGALRRAATSEELAETLGMHVNGVRRHLERMQESGLLERRRVRHGRGRPRDEWSIAPDASPLGPPEGYVDVARWLARAAPTGPTQLRRIEQTGQKIGRELAPGRSGDPAESVRQAFAALGFQPTITPAAGGALHCRLRNCPYKESVRENPDVICRLHKGITAGFLEGLDPAMRLTRFEPRDPDQAGCEIDAEAAAPATDA